MDFGNTLANIVKKARKVKAVSRQTGSCEATELLFLWKPRNTSVHFFAVQNIFLSI